MAMLQLDFPGVTIQDVSVDELVTYFEDFDIDLLNALDDSQELEDVEIKACVRRLNHRPFAVSITVKSDHEATAAVRILLGPKVDWFGQEITINEKRPYIVEIDKFTAKRKAIAELLKLKTRQENNISWILGK
jgi:hypothetical protein